MNDFTAGDVILPNITTLDFSVVVGITPIQVFPANLFANRKFFFMRIINVGSVPIWLSRSGTAAWSTAGSFPLYAGGSEKFSGRAIPTNNLSAVATAADAQLTV